MDITKIAELAVEQLMQDRESYETWLAVAERDLKNSVYIDSYNEELRVRDRCTKSIKEYTEVIEAIDAELERRGNKAGK